MMLDYRRSPLQTTAPDHVSDEDDTVITITDDYNNDDDAVITIRWPVNNLEKKLHASDQ